MPWATFGADVPRFVMPANRILVEGQRTNGLLNPRCEGAALGTPGTMPMWWGNVVPSGVTRTVVGTGVEFGLPYIELRLQTAGATTAEPVEFQSGHVSASPGQTWTCSAFHRLVAGSMVNATLAMRLYELGGPALNTDAAFMPTATLARTSATRTVVDAGSFVVNGRIFLQTTGAADLTLRLYAPQVEQGGFASTPILPPAGTPGASTRGADVVTAPLASLGIGGNGAGVYLWTSVHSSSAVNGASETMVAISDGTMANRFAVARVENSNNSVRLLRNLAGVDQSSLAVFAAATLTRFGLSLDGTGRGALSIEGAAPIIVTGGPSAGLTSVRLGSMPDSSAQLFGEFGTLRVIPSAVPDATLQSLVAGLPT